MRRPELRWLLLLLLLALLSGPLPALAQTRPEQPLRAGWYASEPQQYLRQGELTGLDIEMVRAIARRAGQELRWTPMDYLPLMEEVAAGRMDLIPGIAATEARGGCRPSGAQRPVPARRAVRLQLFRCGAGCLHRQPAGRAVGHRAGAGGGG